MKVFYPQTVRLLQTSRVQLSFSSQFSKTPTTKVYNHCFRSSEHQTAKTPKTLNGYMYVVRFNALWYPPLNTSRLCTPRSHNLHASANLKDKSVQFHVAAKFAKRVQQNCTFYVPAKFAKLLQQKCTFASQNPQSVRLLHVYNAIIRGLLGT